MKKIVHMTSVHPQNDNRIFYKECATLVKNGYEVTLIAAGAQSNKVDGINIIGITKEKGRIARIIKTAINNMIKTCLEIDADIYHFHDPELIFAGLYLKLVGKKVIYDIHENNPASILSKPYIKSKFIKKMLAEFFDLFEKSTIGFFDAVVTARPDITQRFKHKNIITLRNFPILPKPSNTKPITIEKIKPTVIFVGGMHTQRGIHELLDAFKVLNKYELWLLGPFSDKELEERVKNGCQNVRYLGIVEAYEVFDYIQKADIGIITFLKEPNHINTLATKPFEYMACGKPIIMSNFKYWRQTFKKSSLYVDPSDPQAIAKTVKKLFEDKALMESMGALNQKLSRNEYNWEKESLKLVNLYKKMGS